MNFRYESQFNEHIVGFLAKRAAFGYSCREMSYAFQKFDRFCLKQFPTEAQLTQEIADTWLGEIENYGAKSKENLVCHMRIFARYLNGIGIEAYEYPFGITKKPQKYIPHIFSFEELNKLFSVADSMAYSTQAKVRHLVIPILFRLMYCCGLRPKEATHLLIESVDLESGIIHISESKGHRERFIMISDDVCEILIRYREKINRKYPQTIYFFPSCQGNKCYNVKEVKPFLDKLLKEAEIADCPGNAPRLYDFRHTFASHCIYRWVQNGEDIYANLPFLSEYMGHICLESTLYYVHLVPDYFNEIDTVSLEKFSHLIPEVTI